VIDETTTDGAPEEEPTAAAAESTEETTEAPAAEAAEQPVAEADEAPAAEAEAEAPVAEADAEDDDEEVDETPRVKPAIPGADLEVDIVEEGADPFSGGSDEDSDESDEDDDLVDHGPITTTIELAADARYRATGKRKTAVARVTLKPGTGKYTINGKDVDAYFPRATLQRVLRQPLEVVALEEKVDVVAAIHGGGVAAQAGALRHGISRALLEADPQLRTELKRRGFLTRDARVKERKKAGLKKARKRPQFSKR
jgi:small subunit ribosomal protein S9